MKQLRISKRIVATLLLVIILIYSANQLLGRAPQTVRNYIFGHSLIVHSPPAIPTPSDETTVPHWLFLLAQEGGHSYAVDGQYGFLRNHAELPPSPQWGFDLISGVWDVDGGMTFADSDFTTILLTAGNFIQYQPSTVPYDGDNPTNETPLGATLTIIDWLMVEEPGIDIYIYENWPEMAGFMNSFPPTAQEFATYNQYTLGGFHDWWVDYDAEIASARPSANVVTIPVGPIISTIIADPMLSQIPITELYEDDAPHGRPTLYFLASLITYMSIYGEQAPASYVVPNTVHVDVRDNYNAIVQLIWDELVAYGVVSVTPTYVSLNSSNTASTPQIMRNALLIGAATVLIITVIKRKRAFISY